MGPCKGNENKIRFAADILKKSIKSWKAQKIEIENMQETFIGEELSHLIYYNLFMRQSKQGHIYPYLAQVAA